MRGKKTPQPKKKKKRIYLDLKSGNIFFATQNAIHTLPLQIVQLDFNIQYQTYSLETDSLHINVIFRPLHTTQTQLLLSLSS